MSGGGQARRAVDGKQPEGVVQVGSIGSIEMLKGWNRVDEIEGDVPEIIRQYQFNAIDLDGKELILPHKNEKISGFLVQVLNFEGVSGIGGRIQVWRAAWLMKLQLEVWERSCSLRSASPQGVGGAPVQVPSMG